MAKAARKNITPRRTASSSQKSSPEPAAAAAVLPVDPVVELAKKLMNAWDADYCADSKYPESELLEKEAAAQLREWRGALETVITYAQPATFQGALVQMALGLDTLSQMDGLIEDGDKEDLSERVRTAVRLPMLGDARDAVCARPGNR
jgi:hypothetical protein